MAEVVVITGGGGGMGLATARVVGGSCTVLLTDRDQDRLDRARAGLREQGIEAHVHVGDVTDRLAVDELVTRARSIGDLVSVVHTAGVSPQMGPAEMILRVNALGTVNVNQAFLPLAREGFRIVNVASSAGHLPAAFPVPKRAYRLATSDPQRMLDKMVARCDMVPEKLRPGIAYAISKNFVIWFSRHLAGELGAKGARVMSVSPGSFDTEMGRLEDASGSGALARMSALHRHGTVEEIAEVLAFCASDKPGYLTGTDLLVDGGADAVMTIKDTIAMARSV